MWRLSSTIAFRTLIKNRAYTFINLFGLALGLAACLLILLYVRYETSYDSWLPDSERIYQVQAKWHEPGQPVTEAQTSPFLVRETLPGGFPQIEALTVVRTGQTVTMRDGEAMFIDAATVDPSFFAIFDLPFAHGDAAGALRDTNTIALTETEAVRQFGTTDVVGRTMSLGAGPGKQDYRIGAVLRDLPKNSSLRLAILFRNDPTGRDAVPPSARTWGNMNQLHYVKLRVGADPAAINAALPAWEKRVVVPQMIGGRASSQADIMDLSLAPISDVHLGRAQAGALTPGGDKSALVTFGIVAVLTLGMAVMNFVNLSTARATQRAREVALRKVLGATRPQIVVQLVFESLVLAGLAMLIALAFVELLAPWLGGRIGADLDVTYFGARGLLLPALALFLAAGLLGGLYPALFLSRFRPAQVLRANKSSAETPGNGRLRTILVVVQFAIAIGLIVCTSVIYAQTRHVATVDPGYRREGLIQIDSAWRFAGDSSEYEAARRELLAVPGVTAAGRTDLGLAAVRKNILSVRTPDAAQDASIGYYSIDADYLETIGVRLLAGRQLGDRYTRDRIARAADGAPAVAAGGINVVLNRNAVTLLGLGTPQAAVGKTVKIGIDTEYLSDATIVGVVEDTRIRTARDAIEPIVYGYDPDRTSLVVVRYASADPAAVMSGINRVWRRFEPEIPFQAAFSENLIAEIYAADRARGALFAAFAVVAVSISCLGLFGLAAFTAERRTKEIGIRKVLGARIRDIVRLLTWQFSKPVVLANLAAWPVAWWAMRNWLNTFDVRVPLTPGPFLLAGLLALAIAIGTVAGHAIRVARLNPIQALRYE
ncbi:ABC transporter permease [Sphingosinicella sp. BN140058]|uniref:ABC transporter permease n=1 Tax=Sphingosinicella sp. BN140058 TaxID=1892855 RepID=UPI0010137257|nr:ABC transporter permease [Sphingosinicella sp. BN140058]QAY76822.1 FtsX-like permease family protein [Sphingosinicella sp. BN140058]